MTRLGKIGKWARRSLLNQILLCEAIISAPSFLIFCAANYFEGTLTFGWALSILLATVLEGVAFAVPTWFLFVVPRSKMHQADRQNQQSKSGTHKQSD